MSRHNTELTYLRAAVQDASPVGLVIVLYDLLIGDLKRAIAAMANKDVEERSKELKHAFLVLQQLDGSLEMETGGEAAINLSRFYGALRANIMDAHVTVKPEILTRQIQLLLEVREAWEQADKASVARDSAPKTEYVEVENREPGAPEGPQMAVCWSA